MKAHGTALEVTATGVRITVVGTKQGDPSGEFSFDVTGAGNDLVLTPTGGAANDGGELNTGGLGDIHLGMTRADAVSGGWYVDDGGFCPQPSDAAVAMGATYLYFFGPGDTLSIVGTTDASVRTPSGAHVGMTLSELQATYGSQLVALDTNVMTGAPGWGVAADDGNSIVFQMDAGGSAVEVMYAQSGPPALNPGVGNC
ncbi:hypothetical protein EG850_06180 [Gulosibacter macacae]|uniref:Uncharacterized protein n=1 Tax=Gulosibacter macacae TaxID=2488791 RepID=A0A3P3VXB6_9MICO|nr:hypothetical protein [Gulosibacter macacae]RRJ86987.1 hypothetical protein EG850_06180 [Gulosibacter macacae]